MADQREPAMPLPPACPRCGSTSVETTCLGWSGAWDPNSMFCRECKHKGNAGDWAKVAELRVDRPVASRPVFTEEDVARIDRCIATIRDWEPRLLKSAKAIGADVANQLDAIGTAAWLCGMMLPLARPTEDGELLWMRTVMCEVMSLLGQAQEVSAVLERYGRSGHVNRGNALSVALLLQTRLQALFDKIGMRLEGEQPEEGGD